MLAENPELSGQIAYKAAYYVAQKYNGLFHAGPLAGQAFTESHSFCSQLIARVFADLQIPLFNTSTKSERVLPVHLDEITAGLGWTDVTDGYRRYFEGRLKLSTIDLELDKIIPIPDIRVQFIDSVSILVRSSAHQQQAIKTIEDVIDLTSDFGKILSKLSKAELQKVGEQLGMKTGSIRSIYDSMWQSALVLELHSRKPATKAWRFTRLFWFAAKKPESPEIPIGELHRMSIQTLDITQKALEDFTNVFIRGAFWLFMAPKNTANQDLQEAYRRQIRSLREILKSIENWDGYVEDIQALETEFQEKIAATPLTSGQAFEIVLRAMGQIRWRVALSVENRIHMVLDRLEANPDDPDSRAAMLRGALSLAPLTPRRANGGASGVRLSF